MSSSSTSLPFEMRTLPNGEPNPKYVDLLFEDPPIAGQKYCCTSFINPDKILKKRETFLFEKFVEQWDLTKSMTKFSDFLNFAAYKHNLKIDILMADFNDFLKEESAKLKTDSAAEVENDWRTFLDKNEDNLNQQFAREHAFQTSARAIKQRGNFATMEEAEIYAEKLRNLEPYFDVHVGSVGVWSISDPDPFKTRINYAEPELNRLYEEKMKNEEKAKQEFENRVKEAKKKAIEENIAKATKSGNVLTQTLDDNGNLIGVKEVVNFEERDAAPKDTADIHAEMLRKAAENAMADAIVD